MVGKGQIIITAERIRKRVRDGEGEAIPAGRDGFIKAKVASTECSLFRAM